MTDLIFGANLLKMILNSRREGICLDFLSNDTVNVCSWHYHTDYFCPFSIFCGYSFFPFDLVCFNIIY